MKRIILPCLLTIACAIGCKPPAESTAENNPDPAHNSMVSLDWDGSYRGILPCADCEGIETVITLNKNMNYRVRRKYLGKQDSVFFSQGTFSWNTQGSAVSLDEETPSLFQVGENRLVQLDMEGKKITGNLADKYILTKIPAGITEKYWKLTELSGKPVQAGNNKEPHIIFKAETGRINGTGGCNNLMGNYEIKTPDRIVFSQLASTQMACLNMETEDQLLKVLGIADSYTLNGDTLVLNKARMAPLARFVAVYLR